jgi:frataxin-like iron-binding protein CyaY
LYDVLDKGTEELRELNTFVSVDRAADDSTFKLDMGDEGFFLLCKSPTNPLQLMVQSPKSGVHTYNFSEERLYWEAVRDEHQLLELVARDIISIQCMRGIPDF